MQNITKQQINTLTLIKGMEETVKTGKLKGESVDCESIADIYGMLWEDDEKDTFQLLQETIELQDLGYISTNITKEDLGEEMNYTTPPMVISRMEVCLTERGNQLLKEYYSNTIKGIENETTPEGIIDRLTKWWKDNGADILFTRVVPLVEIGLGIASLYSK